MSRAGSGLNIEGSGQAWGIYFGLGLLRAGYILSNKPGLSMTRAWALLGK
jgi:hypothetical protein